MKKIITVLLLLTGLQVMAQEDSAVKKVAYPSGYRGRLDVVYVTVNGWEGRADIYYNTGAAKPTPVLFNIHGGGWNHGTKESQAGFGGFFKQGYAVVNVEYRLVQTAPAPAAVEDIRSVILYTVEHAKEFNIDPHKIIMMGASAGGHLALMGGLLQNDHRFDGDNKNSNDFTIAAIIDKYGLADFTVPGIEKYKSELKWLGNYWKNPALLQSVSPIYYVKKTSPPAIIIHGDADPRIPYRQSAALYEKYREAGATVKFITVPGGLHGNFTREKNLELNKAIMTFLTDCGL